jgi:hypothetical protein
MKSGKPERKKTVRLKISEDIGFTLIGISSHENDYRLVWAMNNALKMQFVKTENLLVHQTRLKADLEFDRFVYTDEDKYLTYYLISNRCADGILFPEIKNFDFLIQINGETSDARTREFLKKLKSVEVISACYRLEPGKIKGVRDVLQE